MIQETQPFPCTACGACCRRIAGIAELAEFDNGNGICKYLDSHNRCAIYAKRPEICRVDVSYTKKFAKYCSKQEFYTLNLKACEILQRQNKF